MGEQVGNSTEYLSLCYHYIRPEAALNPFPRILGNSRADFVRHLVRLAEKYRFIDLEEAHNLSYSGLVPTNKKRGILLTFDDGLSDHYWAAQTLAKAGIRGVFFIPTCILSDLEPANPTIIHYCLADFGIAKFISSIQIAMIDLGIRTEIELPEFRNGVDRVWDAIGKIKEFFIYTLKAHESRQVLLTVYRMLMLNRYSDALERMHLTRDQVREIMAMGHYLGVHTHTHVSVAGGKLSQSHFFRELVFPKEFLQQEFSVTVNSLSYPFGSPRDCLDSRQLQSLTNEYELAFTVEEIVNSKATSPLELGRYMPMSTDNEEKLIRILDEIILKSKEVSI